MSKIANRDIFWSLASQGLPAVIALVSIPILIQSYGIERFGLLTFFWLILNYISFLDLGITRALTKTISSLGTEISDDRLAVIKSGFVFLSFTGALGLVSLFAFNEIIIGRYLNLSPSLINEARMSLYAIAVTLPALLLFSFFKSILEGLKNFSSANSLQIASGLISYLAPLVCLLITQRLDIALFAVAISRWAVLGWAAALATKSLGVAWIKQSLKRNHFMTLFSEGFWFSLLTILNPLLIYLDRFLVTSAVPMTDLAYYTTPFEIVTRFWLVPMAVTRILFPFFSASQGEWTPDSRKFFRLGLIWIAVLITPPSLILTFWGNQVIGWWLGASFSEQSGEILRVLIVGVFFNCLNWVPFTMIQASRDIYWTVIIPVIELVVFIMLFFLLVDHYGIVGAAYAWSGRLILDAFVWFGLSYRKSRLADRNFHSN